MSIKNFTTLSWDIPFYFNYLSNIYTQSVFGQV